MDRTSWIGVLVCLILLFTWGWWSAKETAKRAAEQAERDALAPPPEAVESTTDDAVTAEGDEPSDGEDAPDASDAAVVTTVLANDAITLNLTSKGAGISTAELNNYAKDLGGEEPIAINASAKNPIGAISTGPGQFDRSPWTVLAESADEISYQSKSAEGFSFTKTFRLPGPDEEPHQISMDLVIRNDAATPLELNNRFLYSGGARPLHLNEWSMQIGLFWLESDGRFDYKTVDHYGGKKILGIFGKSEIPHDRFQIPSLKWGGVNDQFFTTIIAPETPYPAEIWGSRYPVVVADDEEASKKRRMFAAESGIGLPVSTYNPGDQQTYRYRIYLGPKEFARLKDLGDEKQLVMHYDEIPVFGWLFGWAIKPLASWLIMGLVFLKGIVGGYGLAIILITILIRLLIWPVYAKSARSMKRMSKLTPMMKEIREKHADDPQKMNEETMKLYRTYNINPLGGCLPMFIQLPVFLAFYRMLWSAAELRHESFLWVDDLAMPDTLFDIPGLGIPFNLLPILMGITSFAQIAITPKTGDKTQQMIFMLMPIIFLVICYNFAAALSLYWTTSNAFSILQTWLMNKMPEPELEKKATSGKKSFMERMQENAEAARRNQGSGGSASRDRTKLASEKGARHTKGKKKRK